MTPPQKTFSITWYWWILILFKVFPLEIAIDAPISISINFFLMWDICFTKWAESHYSPRWIWFAWVIVWKKCETRENKPNEFLGAYIISFCLVFRWYLKYLTIPREISRSYRSFKFKYLFTGSTGLYILDHILIRGVTGMKIKVIHS